MQCCGSNFRVRLAPAQSPEIQTPGRAERFTGFASLISSHPRKDRVADRFSFTGLGPLGYPSYVDLSTDTMLIAETGGTYGMRAVEPAFPVPPGDGRWTAARPVPPGPPPPPVAAKQPVTVPAAPEGGAA